MAPSADRRSSGSFSVGIDVKNTVELHSFTTTVGVSSAPSYITDAKYAAFPTTDIRHILPRLVPSFHAVASKRDAKAVHGDSLAEKQKAGKVEKFVSEPDGKEIKHAWFWPKMGDWFADTGRSDSSGLRVLTAFPLDIIITETGTSSFGLTNVALPSHSTYVAQILWGAIGWSVGACLGAALAATEGSKRRTILFVGDGSLQLVGFCFDPALYIAC